MKCCGVGCKACLRPLNRVVMRLNPQWGYSRKITYRNNHPQQTWQGKSHLYRRGVIYANLEILLVKVSSAEGLERLRLGLFQSKSQVR
jgi:hypothetical protein